MLTGEGGLFAGNLTIWLWHGHHMALLIQDVVAAIEGGNKCQVTIDTIKSHGSQALTPYSSYITTTLFPNSLLAQAWRPALLHY